MIIRPAGGYLLCSKCKAIASNDNYGNKNSLLNPKIPFPECGHQSVRELWPRWDVLSITDDWDFSNIEPKNVGALKLILYNSIFDFLLEDFLVDFLIKINTPKNILDYTLNNLSNIRDRFALFKTLSGDSLEEILNNHDFSGFVRECKDLRTKRNEFVHRTFEIDFDSLSTCFEVIERDMLLVFVFLNNKYIKE